MNWEKFSLTTVAMVTNKNLFSLDTVPKNLETISSWIHILLIFSDQVWYKKSRAAKIFTRKQIHRFSENGQQSPELKKNCFLFSIKFNISSRFIFKNILQYKRAISKCLNKIVMIEKSRNQLPTLKKCLLKNAKNFSLK